MKSWYFSHKLITYQFYVNLQCEKKTLICLSFKHNNRKKCKKKNYIYKRKKEKKQIKIHLRFSVLGKTAENHFLTECISLPQHIWPIRRLFFYSLKKKVTQSSNDFRIILLYSHNKTLFFFHFHNLLQDKKRKKKKHFPTSAVLIFCYKTEFKLFYCVYIQLYIIPFFRLSFSSLFFFLSYLTLIYLFNYLFSCTTSLCVYNFSFQKTFLKNFIYIA